MLSAAAATGAGAFIGIVGFLAIAAMYFLPTIIATSRKVSNTGSVFVINLLLGWSVIGWVVALAMAVKSKTPQVVMMTSSASLPACTKCGVNLTPGQQFCSNCGTARLITG